MPVTFERQWPTVSIIIPTRNRAAWLAYVFDALARQVYPSDLVEVVVVDNASYDQTDEVVSKWAEHFPFQLRLYRKKNEGPASSRNYGVAHSNGEIIAFTDSDCMPEPNWLRNGVAALGNDGGLVAGPIFPRRTEDTHFFFNAQVGAVVRDTGLYRTANLFVSRRVYDSVGGFDETFALGRNGALLGGEDTDFGWRIRRSGRRPIFQPNVAIVHLATPVSVRNWLVRPVLAQTMARLLRTVPELRQTVLWHRYFHSDEDFFVVLGAAGIAAALALRWWPAALLAMGFVWSIRGNLTGALSRGQFHKAFAMLVLLVVRAGINVCVLSYASVRYRRMVL